LRNSGRLLASSGMWRRFLVERMHAGERDAEPKILLQRDGRLRMRVARHAPAVLAPAQTRAVI
jgi:hypothetical protein